MVWASPQDWLAVLSNMTDADEATCMELRDEWTREELVLSFMATDAADMQRSWAWLDEEDRPVALVAIAAVGRPAGIMEAWSLATPRLASDGHGMAYTRAVRRMVDSVIASGYVRRMYALSWPQHPTSARWLKALGFTFEGAMPGYGSTGDTFNLYGRGAWAE